MTAIASMTSFSAFVIRLVKRRKFARSIRFAVADNAVPCPVRSGIANSDLRCRVFIAGGAAAIFAICALVRLAGGPAMMSNLAFALSARLALVGSSRRRDLCFSATLGTGWLLFECRTVSCRASAVLDLVVYWWISSTLGTGVLLHSVPSCRPRAPSTNRCSSRASVDAFGPPIPLIVCTTAFMANMTLSACVIDGFVIRLCLKCTVSDNLSLLVSLMWHVCVR